MLRRGFGWIEGGDGGVFVRRSLSDFARRNFGGVGLLMRRSGEMELEVEVEWGEWEKSS